MRCETRMIRAYPNVVHCRVRGDISGMLLSAARPEYLLPHMAKEHPLPCYIDENNDIIDIFVHLTPFAQRRYTQMAMKRSRRYSSSSATGQSTVT